MLTKYPKESAKVAVEIETNFREAKRSDSCKYWFLTRILQIYVTDKDDKILILKRV